MLKSVPRRSWAPAGASPRLGRVESEGFGGSHRGAFATVSGRKCDKSPFPPPARSTESQRLWRPARARRTFGNDYLKGLPRMSLRLLPASLACALLAAFPLASQTARCGDGTYSYSAHRRGTCSHHGGVAQWLSPTPASTSQAPTQTLTDTSPQAHQPAPMDSMPWVASSRGHTYYRRGCSTANRLAPQNVIYFRTEQDAQKAGYHRSRSKGC